MKASGFTEREAGHLLALDRPDVKSAGDVPAVLRGMAVIMARTGGATEDDIGTALVELAEQIETGHFGISYTGDCHACARFLHDIRESCPHCGFNADLGRFAE